MGDVWSDLYEVQDWTLHNLNGVEHEFYLTGGTALSRGYYNHRYSEDLDFFVNDSPDFELWRDRCLDELARRCDATEGFSLEVLLREARFGRAIVRGKMDLKLEFVNDVPFRTGDPVRHHHLGLLDTKENILANKVSALVDRNVPKDLADIFWLCCRDRLSIADALKAAQGKAAGIFPPLVAKRLAGAAGEGLPEVFWTETPAEIEYRQGLESLADSLM